MRCNALQLLLDAHNNRVADMCHLWHAVAIYSVCTAPRLVCELVPATELRTGLTPKWHSRAWDVLQIQRSITHVKRCSSEVYPLQSCKQEWAASVRITQKSGPRLEQSPKRSSWRMRCATFPRCYTAASHGRSSPRRRCERA